MPQHPACLNIDSMPPCRVLDNCSKQTLGQLAQRDWRQTLRVWVKMLWHCTACSRRLKRPCRYGVGALAGVGWVGGSACAFGVGRLGVSSCDCCAGCKEQDRAGPGAATGVRCGRVEALVHAGWAGRGARPAIGWLVGVSMRKWGGWGRGLGPCKQRGGLWV